MKNILIIGAASAIAEASARQWASQGAALFLVGRDGERLDAIAADLKVRGAADVHVHTLDVTDHAGHEEMLRQATVSLGQVDVALIAHGTLPDQDQCHASIDQTAHEFEVNGSSTIRLMSGLAALLRNQASGTLVVISSVAGDRGRASNAIYGAAKSAVTAYASALRQHLFRHGAKVLTVKPGFVDTPMTAGFAKGALWASPQRVARSIVRAVESGREVIYTPWFWRPVMTLIRMLPEVLFKRLRF